MKPDAKVKRQYWKIYQGFKLLGEIKLLDEGSKATNSDHF